MEPEQTPSTPEKTAAEVVHEAATEKDGKTQASEQVVHDAAHAAAQLEADAAIAAAKAEEEAEKLAKAAGGGVAQKWLEQRFTEIETKANASLEELKKWLDARLAQIEGRKPDEKAAAAEGSGAPPAAPPETKHESAPPAAPEKRRFRKI